MAIGGAILQNGLLTKLPTAFTSLFPRGIEIAYATIPEIPNLDPALRETVQQAFATSLKTVWQVMLGVSALGLLSSLPMSHYELTTRLDEKWVKGQSEEESIEGGLKSREDTQETAELNRLTAGVSEREPKDQDEI